MSEPETTRPIERFDNNDADNNDADNRDVDETSQVDRTTEVAGPRGGWPLGLLLGLLAAVIGLAPWLLTGAHLPLQNLWQTETLPADMPRVLLPIGQYAVTSIVALLGAGAVLAGLIGRWRRARGRSGAAVVLAAATVQLVAIAQSFNALRLGLGLNSAMISDPNRAPDARAVIYWLGMLIGTLVVWIASIVVASLINRGARSAATLGLVVAAVPLGSWAGLWLAAYGGPGQVPTITGEVVRWTPAIVVALALAWCGLRSVGSAVVWLIAFGLLYVLPAVVAAVTTALGTRVLQGNVRETIAVMIEVFRAAMVAHVGLIPAAAALVAGAIGAGLLALLGLVTSRHDLARRVARTRR